MKPNKEEKKWKKALTCIIEELDKNQYEKMLQLLDDIPKSMKKKRRVEMAQIIIQHLGIKKSILKMKNILEEIPRRDSVVQDLLRPFVDKQSKFPEKNKDLLIDGEYKKVTCNTDISKLGHNTPLIISADLEIKAKGLINIQWPVFSIAEAKNSQEKTEMTIEGTIADMNNVENKKVKGARTRKKTTKLRKLTLQDASGSIRVCFWGDQVGRCSTLVVGDIIRVTNVRSTEFMGTMSLNSTGMTSVYPVKVASVQTGQINIIGIVNASKKETTLEAELNQQTQKFVVESKLLAKACKMKPNKEEKKWKKALTCIIEELSKNLFEKMLHLLDDIPKSKKKNKLRDEMPQIIIQHLGIKKSILKMKNILEAIPRRDSVVQDLLRPFVDKQSKSTEKNKGPKRPCVESDTEDEEPEAAAKKRKYVSESETESEEDREEKKHQSDKENGGPSCKPCRRQTVQDLNATGCPPGKAIMGKVIQKSGLRPYETKKKEKHFLFFVGFADDTGATRLTVYGRPLFDKIQEGHFYKFTDLLIDGEYKKVTCNTDISKLGHNTPLIISADLEMKAKGLINIQWPVFSIAAAKNSQEKTEMTIEGTITDMNNVENKKVKGARTRKTTTKLRKLTLQDASGSIRVCFWGDQVGRCSTLVVGDIIRVTNVRSTEFMGTMSLNSTGMTSVYPVKDASVQTGQINIIGIVNASKKETTLEAEHNQQTQKFVVESKLLAKACGFRLEGDIEDKLLAKMPFRAEVTMRGNIIEAITKM